MPIKKVSKLDQVHRAVRILNTHMQKGYHSVGPEQLVDGLAATFELIEQPWDVPDSLWRQGYEQCMIDFVDALADEWGVSVWEA